MQFQWVRIPRQLSWVVVARYVSKLMLALVRDYHMDLFLGLHKCHHDMVAGFSESR